MSKLSPSLRIAAATLLFTLASPAFAATTAPTCLALRDKCVAHAAKMEAKPAADDGIARPRISADECYDSYRAATETGIWPAHVPFNVATNCSN